VPSRRSADLKMSNGSSLSGKRIGDVFVRADHPRPPGTWHRLSSWPVVGRRTVQRLVMRLWTAREPCSGTFNRPRNEERLTENSRGGAAIGAALAESVAHGGDDELTQRIKGD